MTYFVSSVKYELIATKMWSCVAVFRYNGSVYIPCNASVHH